MHPAQTLCTCGNLFWFTDENHLNTLTTVPIVKLKHWDALQCDFSSDHRIFSIDNFHCGHISFTQNYLRLRFGYVMPCAIWLFLYRKISRNSYSKKESTHKIRKIDPRYRDPLVERCAFMQHTNFKLTFGEFYIRLHTPGAVVVVFHFVFFLYSQQFKVNYGVSHLFCGFKWIFSTFCCRRRSERDSNSIWKKETHTKSK